MKLIWPEMLFFSVTTILAIIFVCLVIIGLARPHGLKKTGQFCGQLSCSVLKEITLRPGTPVPIGDMDCKCSRWDEVPVSD